MFVILGVGHKVENIFSRPVKGLSFSTKRPLFTHIPPSAFHTCYFLVSLLLQPKTLQRFVLESKAPGMSRE
jgi:hypothetical protein